MITAMILLTLGCSGETEKAPLEFCTGTTTVQYDPLNSKELLGFPDDFLTRSDPTSPTGLRIDLSVERAPWTAELPEIFIPVIEDISTQSGFARLGGAVIRFSSTVNSGPLNPADSLTDDGLIWLDLSVSPPERIAFTSSLGEAQDQLILKPVKPLRGGAQHAVLITNQHKDTEGNCIAPAPLVSQLIEGTAPTEYDVLQERYGEAIEAAGIAPEDLSHLLVFTTQADIEIMYEVADDIAERDFSWWNAPACNEEEPSYCEGDFIAQDYRTNGTIKDTETSGEWPISVHSWLPKQHEPPYPVLIYGHGINGRAEEADRVANVVSSLGIAVIAIDALHHGQHPTADPDNSLPALAFLGINLSEFVFDTKNLRGSFDQSTADRLQLLALLKQHPDLDGDGVDDLNMEQLIYYGISLGGLMGPQLMATGGMKAGILAVAGGDLPVFSTDTTTVPSLDAILEILVGPPDVFDRMVPLLQTAVDSSDPAIWGVHVMNERYDGADIPDLLFPVSLYDDTVPPATAKALAHGLNIPHLSPVMESVPLLDVVEGPLQGNLPSGATAAYFQFDRITHQGNVIQANHDNLPHSPESVWMIRHFLETHLAGNAEIRDPYSELETPPLVE